MKLSIITINLNNADGLQKTIESVINQSYNDIEYLIVDGGSTDRSVEVIKKYQDKISWWISEKDRGIYHAMNKAIEKATGTYCQFLNSGDWLSDYDCTTNMLTPIPESSIVYGNLIKILPSGGKFYNKEIDASSLFTYFKGTLNHSSTYIKKELFEKYGYYDENLKIVSDWKFFLIVVGLNNESITYRDIDLVYFDMNGVSNTSEKIIKKEREQILSEVLPSYILTDYEKYANDIIRINRINQCFIFRKLFWLMDRILFKLEKWKIPKR